MTVGGYLIAVGVAASVLLALAVALWLQARSDRRDAAEYEDDDPGVSCG